MWTTEFLGVNSLSSPRLADLNGDGVKDVVIGGGVEEDTSSFGFLALNGADGELLWSHFAEEQVFTSPVFMDLNEDENPDVILGGRLAQLFAFDGLSGQVLWQFYTGSVIPDSVGLYNFYTGQPIPDQNNDNVPDLLVTNGGDRNALPSDTVRPTGHVMIISGADGAELAYMAVPDSQETYCSPVVDDFGTGELWVVYGTGGETNRGGLWRTRLSDVMVEDPENSELLHSSSTNGYVAPPSLADLTGDGIYDIITCNYAGELIAVNGASGELVWQRTFENSESNINPCIGQFNSDGTPDMTTIIGIGEWFIYDDFISLIIDGSNGEVVDSTALGVWNLASYLAVDFNEDGIDEIISIRTGSEFNTTLGQEVMNVTVVVTDPQTESVLYQFGPHNGANPFYTPIVADLDNNGMADIIYAFTEDSLQVFSNSKLIVRRIETNLQMPETPAWSGYMGTHYDGKYGTIDPVGIEAERSHRTRKNATALFDVQGREVSPNTQTHYLKREQNGRTVLVFPFDP